MNTAVQEPRKAALAFIFVTVLIDMLSFGMIIPVLPILVQDFAGGDAARGAEIYGAFGTAWALMQLIFSPVQGALSDRFGRRAVILISCLGLGLDFILMALAPNLWWLFLGRLISGICAASFSTAGAYISDVTPPEKRAASFGMMGAAFGVGFVLGPAIGGVLGAISPRLPFWAAAGMSLLNVAWGLFVLPESLPRDRRVPFSWRSANPIGALKLLGSHPMLAGLARSFFLINLAHVVFPSITVLYLHYRYGWDAKQVGAVLAGTGISSLLVQVFLIKRAVKLLRERLAMWSGLRSAPLGLRSMDLPLPAPPFGLRFPSWRCGALPRPLYRPS
jgi:MFS transporter, DHA1 family, tetracycline resistance protein